MNMKQIREIDQKFVLAGEQDLKASGGDPMSIDTPHFDAVVAEMGQAQFLIYMECKEALAEAGDLTTLAFPALRARACEVCKWRKHIHHVAEALFSHAGLADPYAWNCGHVGIHQEFDQYGLIVAA